MGIEVELAVFADHLSSRRQAILRAWENAVHSDGQLRISASLSEVEFRDHVPALLETFEGELREYQLPQVSAKFREFHKNAASHGMKRWQQGYDLTELVRELGRLNECLVDEIDGFTEKEPATPHPTISEARRIWAQFNTVGIEESVRQYALLQRQEASGQVRDLEIALADLKVIEEQRADLWQEAAHDLRGNLGVVANASVGLTHTSLSPSSKDKFVRILIRNVTSLHRMLDDVTQLARLQAGYEKLRIEQLDVTPLMHELCEGIRPVSDQKSLYLRCEGPPGLGVQGDSVKLRRIAQNLILNAVKFTQSGGITVTWGESQADDHKHWALTIADTGPGFPSNSGRPIAEALKSDGQPLASSPSPDTAPASALSPKVIDKGAGEGLGLSIVKRLCEMLNATIRRDSAPNKGTTFIILVPRTYDLESAKRQSPISG